MCSVAYKHPTSVILSILDLNLGFQKKRKVNLIFIIKPVDNDNINLRDILQYACNSCILWRAKKGLPKFDFRQPLGNPTYSSPNLATPVLYIKMALTQKKQVKEIKNTNE